MPDEEPEDRRQPTPYEISLGLALLALNEHMWDQDVSCYGTYDGVRDELAWVADARIPFALVPEPAPESAGSPPV